MSTAPGIEIEYPTSDGKPMAETDIHRDLMMEIIEVLRGYFADRPDVYVSGNLLVFYEEGNPRRHRAPDAFVVWGVPKHDRENYKIWQEGQAPALVIELTSITTKDEDLVDKFEIYRDVWKVKEYFLFDPREEYLNPSMQGYRLVEGEYQPVEPSFGRLHSETLGLDLERDGRRLIFRDLTTQLIILRPMEQAAAREREAREKLEQEVERLRMELESLRRQK